MTALRAAGTAIRRIPQQGDGNTVQAKQAHSEHDKDKGKPGSESLTQRNRQGPNV